MEHDEELEQRRANQRIRPPGPADRARARGATRPLARLASDIGNQGFASTLGRSPLAREAEQGAGILRRRHRPRRRAVDDRLHARRRASSLDPGVASRLSSYLGDLSDVRVHTDDTADKLNNAVSARAFATGTDVYFAKGEYSPGSAAGDKLIAHELAHVVQQRGASASGPLTVSQPGDAMETRGRRRWPTGSPDGRRARAARPASASTSSTGA